MSNDASQNLIALMKATTAVTDHAGDRFHEDHVPQLKGTITDPFVWLSQRGETPSTVLNGAQGEAPDNVLFDLECSGGTMRRRGQKALSAAVRSLLHNYSGSFGDTTVKGIFVRDKENDHIPVSNGGDQGILVSGFDVEVWL